MRERLDSRALETWTERLVACETRRERENLLSQAASELEGVHAVAVWRELTIGGAKQLTPTTVCGAHEDLPNESQVRAVLAGELSRTGLSRMKVVGRSPSQEAPILTLACDTIEEGALDGLEALLELTRVLEQDSEENALDSVRGLLREFDGESKDSDLPR